MLLDPTIDINSLGLEPKESLGFESEEELEVALAELTREIRKKGLNKSLML